LKVVEHACEGVGVRYRGRHVGTFGDLGVFSFNGNKIMTTGGGGMITTSSAKLAQHARYLTNQAKDDPVEYLHRERGYNYRLTSLQAALGLAQIEQLPGFLAGKRRLAGLYDKALKSLPGVETLPRPAGVEPSFWLYTILLPRATPLARRKAFVSSLNAAGIGCRPLWHNLHELPPFRGCRAYDIEHAPDLYRRAVSLPSGPELGEREVARVRAELARLLAVSRKK